MEQKKILRTMEIETLLEIINNRNIYKENSENGLVILLNGSWGSGKTTFLTQLKERIENEDKIDIFADYNSYEYDFYENAYLPFFAKIEDKIKLEKDFGKLIKCTNKPFFNIALTTAYALINSYLNKKKIINLNDIANNMVEIKNEEVLNDFEDVKNLKEKIKRKMEEYCKDKAQVFIIDELDRCKPTFAMETLEIVKHFFDIKNCVFIISVDKLQLQESAKTIYGQEMDSEKYFSKFFDYHFNLYPLTFSDTIDVSNTSSYQEIITKSNEIFECLDISLRDSKKIFINFINKYEELSKKNIDLSSEQSIFIIFLLTLKYTDLLFYNELVSKNFDSFRNKIENDNSINSIKYHRLLAMEIGNIGENYDSVCKTLSRNINVKYISEEERNTETYPTDKKKLHKTVANELSAYIPYVEDGLNYYQTIKKIIN